ncbi:hypothetical protein FDP41_012402 [Naegleria fowleri]|uniref:Uncharacterized protein n=1 Tax=Naegleria fowleri TaxID=5763 RepID=A0A6A5C8M3_NAEFO|nr:uncharacterized protein FDP41_012402 [Naegleria fowleri]KAF0981745.1 hypothetical protein FDP41_012402 [Naegleria fowleri]
MPQTTSSSSSSKQQKSNATNSKPVTVQPRKIIPKSQKVHVIEEASLPSKKVKRPLQHDGVSERATYTIPVSVYNEMVQKVSEYQEIFNHIQESITEMYNIMKEGKQVYSHLPFKVVHDHRVCTIPSEVVEEALALKTQEKACIFLSPKLFQKDLIQADPFEF